MKTGARRDAARHPAVSWVMASPAVVVGGRAMLVVVIGHPARLPQFLRPRVIMSATGSRRGRRMRRHGSRHRLR